MDDVLIDIEGDDSASDWTPHDDEQRQEEEIQEDPTFSPPIKKPKKSTKKKSAGRKKRNSSTTVSPVTAIHEEEVKPGTNNTDTSVRWKRLVPLDAANELEALTQLNNLDPSGTCENPEFRRIRQKVRMRMLKRERGLTVFDLDAIINRYMKQPNVPTKLNWPAVMGENDPEADDSDLFAKIPPLHSSTYPEEGPEASPIPYEQTYAYRLYGPRTTRETLTKIDEPIVSIYTGKTLQPYIWRDYSAKPSRMRLLEEIKSIGRIRRTRGSALEKLEEGTGIDEELCPIDYVYFQQEHLHQINNMLGRQFWPGIDISEALQHPEYTVVALYKRLVVGCALGTPDGYITYFFVLPGWDRAGIGRFMLFRLAMKCGVKDLTLHVSADNRAMLLYQKFGFKPEEFIVNFYDKYLPSDSKECMNAFFVRLRKQ